MLSIWFFGFFFFFFFFFGGGGGGGLKWGLARKMDILSDYGECVFSTFCAVRSCFIMLAANFQIFFSFLFFFWLTRQIGSCPLPVIKPVLSLGGMGRWESNGGILYALKFARGG